MSACAIPSSFARRRSIETDSSGLPPPLEIPWSTVPGTAFDASRSAPATAESSAKSLPPRRTNWMAAPSGPAGEKSSTGATMTR